MTPFRLILASLRYHLRTNITVALGVAAATAVLTGALLVGDSVRGSLRHLTLDRLGTIDEVLLTDRFFRSELAGELAAEDRFKQFFTAALPAVFLRGTVEKPSDAGIARANKVTILGVKQAFWELHPRSPALAALDDSGIILNRPLAEQLGAEVNDEIILRIPKPGDVPTDSPLGEKIDTSGSRRLTVVDIVPAEGLGRFGINPSQQTPLCAFVATEVLQGILDQPGKVNAILVAGELPESTTPEASAALAEAFHPRPEDFGLNIQQVRIGNADAPVSEYINITSGQMMLPDTVVEAANREFGEQGLQTALAYLANTITSGKSKIPYSTIAGIAANESLGPYQLGDGPPLADDEIVLTDWAADDLGVQPGDTVAITYYEPESTHGELVESPPVEFRVRAIVPLAARDAPPTRANDPNMTPELRGVTDQKSIRDWDLPFELVERIRRVDEDYWDDHKTTPKGYITLAKAREMWGSRFGDTTTLRIPAAEGLTPEAVFERLDLKPAELGMEFLPVKQMGLAASAGTTPFNLLFLAFSFFIIAAAVMLVALLFRLGVEQRAREIGIELAVGIERKRIGRLLAAEGLIVAAVGAALGVVLGVAYAWLMLTGLTTWWVEAITAPFLELYVTPLSLVLGYAIGVFVSLLTILWTLRQMRKVAVRRLLAGRASEASLAPAATSKLAIRMAQGALIVALLLGLMAMQLGGEAQAGAFFGSGSLVLAAALTMIREWFKLGGAASRGVARFGLFRLAWRNGARNPGRSTLTIGLVAAASFLIVAVSAFRLDTTEEGTGGFMLVGESDRPIIHDLNTRAGRDELGMADRDDLLIEPCRIYAFRVLGGDDASCKNLYRPRQPRVLGVPEDFIDHGGFAWAGSAAETEAERENPWLLLDKPLDGGEVPVVIDMNTAMYSLHLWSGVGSTLEIDDDRGGKLTLRVVGLLKNSVLQGDLIISQAELLKHFPNTGGYRFFFVEIPAIGVLAEHLSQPIAAAQSELNQREQTLAKQAPSDPEAQAQLEELRKRLAALREMADNRQAYAKGVEQALESSLGESGLDVTSAQQRLAGFLAVQNTYLSTFQSLGALGLLLGTFGLATVQLRNVFERRGELALMRAAGFRRRVLGKLVLLENGLLLTAGLAVGVFAALVAILPQLIFGFASVPVGSLLGTLATVLVVGILAGILAVRETLKAPLIEALRGD